MAGIKFSIEVKEQEVERLIKDLEHKLSGFGVNQFMKEKGTELLQRRVSRRFISEGDTASGKWAPLSESTERFRKMQGFSPRHPINVRTGGMLTWATNQQSEVRGSNGDIRITYPRRQPTGEMLKKVNTAQKGRRRTNKAGRGEAPPRPIFAVSSRDMNDFIKSLETFVVRGR